jgi:bifunctional DNase/RNase
MTHDLLFQSFSEMGANIVQVVISDLRESTFYAEIMIESSSGRHTIDARPSDAIALALRAEAAVLVNPEFLDTALKGPLLEKIGSEEEIRKWLETAEPEEFGKYKM